MMGSAFPSPTISLKVIVTGGGIGGLSAAIALRRAGHHVTVYERYPADAEAGAGIVVCSNAVRVLQQWGLDCKTVGMLPYREGLIIDGKTLKLIQRLRGDKKEGGGDAGRGEEPLTSEQEESGLRQWMTTRRDLRTLLRAEVERERMAEHGEGSVKVVYGREAVEYDAETPAVLFDDGKWVAADLVVACDGIHSKAARAVLGSENLATPYPMGFSAFRLLITSERLEVVKDIFKDDEMVRQKFEDEAGVTWFAAGNSGNGSPGKLVVWWLCRFGQVHAFDIIIPDSQRYAGKEDWLTKCDKQVLLNELSHFHPLFSEMMERADEPQLWKICKREPAEVIHRRKLCLLGDALHPMPPFRAQGGSQTIEDAGALEMCLTGVKDKSELEERLQILEDLRIPRFSCAQIMSTVRHNEPNFLETFAKTLDQCKKWFEGKDQSHLKDFPSYQAWVLSYDVRKEAAKVIERSF